MADKKSKNRKKNPAHKPRPKKHGSNDAGYAVILLTAIITFIIGLILIAKFGNIFVPPEKPDITPPKPPVQMEMKEVTVYYSDVDGLMLAPEKHSIKKDTIENEVKSALNAAIAKPINENFAAAIPAGTRLLGVSAKGTLLTANFSKELVNKHPGGSSGEIQTVYAIVNTVALNFPQFKEVRILVEGKKTETIAGHIDISVPLAPDRSTIGTKSAKK